MSGTWASTLLATIKSARLPAAASLTPSSAVKNSCTVSMPFFRAARAVEAVGSMPRQGMPRAFTYCNK